ncbi:SDR family oxidoreductase [Edwardsiella piscicida]|nr:SDR family oxidoreductase [Edwardsiella piscicida]WCF12732.1 SDR family oxidoreductase [Edwardsiella piscicida]
MQLTRVMALELAQHGIRVNAFGPGATRTDMTAQSRANPQRRAMFMSKLVDQRYGEPDEIAAVALFLASDEASFINGACYYVDGGYRVQ